MLSATPGVPPMDGQIYTAGAARIILRGMHGNAVPSDKVSKGTGDT